jgi:hypothetical protein
VGDLLRTAKRSCAYCGDDGPLTREEVFADFAVRAVEPVRFRSVASGGEWIRSALAVRDVCAPCNNGPLSMLDNAAKPTIERLLRAHAEPGECLDVETRTIVRWLLKTSYNAARSTGDQLEGHRMLAGFILGTRELTPLPLDCFLGRLGAHPASADGRPRTVVRIGDLVTPDLEADLRVARLVAVNELLFHFLGWRNGVPARQRATVSRAFCRDYRLRRVRLRAPLVIPTHAMLASDEFVEGFDLDRPAMFDAAAGKAP